MKHEMVKGVESHIKTNSENTSHLIARHENECQRGEGFMYLGSFLQIRRLFQLSLLYTGLSEGFIKTI